MKSAFSLFIILFLGQTLYSQVTFQKIFGVNTDGYYASQNADGSFIVTIDSFGIKNIRLNSYGSMLWENTIPHLGFDKPASIEETTSGSFVQCGTSQDSLTGVHSALVMRLDDNGDTMWTKLFPPSGNGNYGSLILPTLDNKFIFSMYEDGPSATNNSQLMKLDHSANIMWTVNSGRNGIGSSGLVQDDDSNFVITHFDEVNHYNIFNNKYTNNGGALLTNSLFDSSASCVCYISRCITTTKDGGYLIGAMNQLNSMFIKLDYKLDTVWTKTLHWESVNSPSSIALDQDSGFVVLIDYDNQINLYHMSADGDSLETKSYNPLKEATGVKIKRCFDGGYLISGTAIDASGVRHAYVLKTDGLLRLTIQCNISSQGPTSFCNGDSVMLVGPAGYSYNWSNGDTTQSIYASVTNSYFLVITGTSGNSATSNAINVYANHPIVPVITNHINYLQVTHSISYQWYLNGLPVTGATHDTIQATGTGNYNVVIVDTNNCLTVSTPLYFSWTGIEDVSENIRIYPSPANDVLHIELPFYGNKITVRDIQNRIVKTITTENKKTDLNTSEIPDGIYFLECEGEFFNVVKRFIILH